ncbi:MAG: hypothetical protein VW683_00350 [Betaproteobacteria bacterium]|jgi:hypothetical protein
MIRTTVIKGNTFDPDVIKYVPDPRFNESAAIISSSADPEVFQAVKQYDNGTKVILYPTEEITDTGDLKWSLTWEFKQVDPVTWYKEDRYNTDFEEIL